MEAISQDIIITSQLDEIYLENCPDPPALRIAYEWLMVEKEMRGQKWFLKEHLDKGKVMIAAGEDTWFWAFESIITVTLDEEPLIGATNHFLAMWNMFNYKMSPYYVRVLMGDKTPDWMDSNVPEIIKGLWEEIKAGAA